jgi:hypothetical protein
LNLSKKKRVLRKKMNTKISIEQSRKPKIALETLLLLRPIAMEEIISFSNLKLSASNQLN